MTAKEYLMQIRKLDNKINRRVKEYDDLKKSLTFISGIDYSRDRVQTSIDGTPGNIKKIGDIVDIESEINALIENLIKARHKIIDEIESLDNERYSELLYKRYVNYMSLEEISVKMNYSYNRIKHLHGIALQAFGNKFLKVDTQ